MDIIKIQLMSNAKIYSSYQIKILGGVTGLLRNRWPPSPGIGDLNRAEYAIGYKDILLVIPARENVIKRTFIFNSPVTACHAIA